jgi:hypothetical protein
LVGSWYKDVRCLLLCLSSQHVIARCTGCHDDLRKRRKENKREKEKYFISIVVITILHAKKKQNKYPFLYIFVRPNKKIDLETTNRIFIYLPVK